MGRHSRSAAAALILGAGRGTRLGGAVPKAVVDLDGVTLLERSLRTLARSEAFGRIQPIVATSDFDRYARLVIDDIEGLQDPIPGGKERQDSMRAGLAALPPEIELVAVHDAARCLVSVDDVRAVVRLKHAYVRFPDFRPIGRPQAFVEAIEAGYASVTPLGLDLTNHEALADLGEVEL